MSPPVQYKAQTNSNKLFYSIELFIEVIEARFYTNVWFGWGFFFPFFPPLQASQIQIQN